MSQYDFGVIDPQTKSGTQLAADLNQWRDAVHTSHGGNSRPAYAVANMIWVDTTTTPPTVKLYDGTVDRVLALAASPTFSGSVTVDGNLAFSGANRRITGDFSNATLAGRTLFQTVTVNGVTAVGAIPNGTATESQYVLYNNVDPSNANVGVLLANSTEVSLRSGNNGSATPLPLTFWAGGSVRMQLGTSGQLGIGGANYGTAGQVLTSAGAGAPPSWQTPPTGFILGTPVSMASADGAFTGLPAGIKRLVLMASGLSTNITADLIAQLGTSAGFVTAGYTSSLGSVSTAGTGTIERTGGAVFATLDATDTIRTVITFTLFIPASNVWAWEFSSYRAGATPASQFGSGLITLPGVMDRVRVTTLGGSFDGASGTANIAYEL